MAIRRSGFELGEDRYKYDFHQCSSANGWAQLDTRNDAHYFGNWINPTTFELFSYCEGDTTLIKCEDEAEFVKEVRQTVDFYKNNGSFIGIDAGVSNPAIRAALERMGLAELLH